MLCGIIIYMKIIQESFDNDLKNNPGVISSRCKYHDFNGTRTILICNQIAFSYQLKDQLSHKIIWVNIYKGGYASQKQISAGVGIPERTLRFWLSRYRKQGTKGLIESPKPGAPKKITEDTKNEIYLLRDSNATIKEIAKKYSVSTRSIDLVLAARKKQNEKLKTKISNSDDPFSSLLLNQSEIDIKESAEAKDRGLERVNARLGVIQDVPPKFEEAKNVEWAGIFMAVAMLEFDPYLQKGQKIFTQFRAAFYGLRTTLITLLLMLLLRQTRPESLRKYDPQKLGKILGLDRAPEVKTLRRKIRQLSQQEKGTELMESLASARIDQKEDSTDIIYIDGHLQKYTGKEKIGKTFSSCGNRVVKGKTENWINISGGLPLISLYCEFNEGLTKKLTETIETAKKVMNTKNVISVFDRGGYSTVLFKEIISKGDHIITYRKGHVKPIPAAKYVKKKITISKKTFDYEPYEQEVTLPIYKKDKNNPKKNILTNETVSLREIRILREDNKETIILTSIRDIESQKIAEIIFSRWAFQENIFKYMIAEFDLDALTQYGIEDINTEGIDHPNPEYINLEKQISKVKTKRTKLLSEVGEILVDCDEKDIVESVKKFKDNKKANKVLTLTNELQELKDLLSQTTPRENVSKAGYKILKTESKLLMNAIKISAYAIESKLFQLLSQFYSNSHKDGRKLIASAFQTKGSIKLLPKKIVIQLDAQSSPSRTKAINSLCKKLNGFKAKYPGSNRVIEFLPTVI